MVILTKPGLIPSLLFQNTFSFNDGGSGVFSNKNFGTSYAITGQADGFFMIRVQEDTNANGNIDVTELWHFDGTNFSTLTNDYWSPGPNVYSTWVDYSYLTNNSRVSETSWTNMIDFVNTIPYPNLTNGYSSAPVSTNDFNDDFIKF
jgi:hypothetical protein